VSAQDLPLAVLRRDGGTQPRAFINTATVDEYAENLGEGISLPPATVFYDGENYWLADGYHRTAAAESLKWETYPCEVIQGSREDAQWYSYGVNKDHGLRRTNRDKQAAVEAALKHPRATSGEMSNYEIAAHCGVAEKTIRNHKEAICGNSADSSTITVTRNGKTYQQKRRSGSQKSGKSAKSKTPDTTKPEPEPQVLAPAPDTSEPQVLVPDTPHSLLQEAVERASEFPADWLARARAALTG